MCCDSNELCLVRFKCTMVANCLFIQMSVDSDNSTSYHTAATDFPNLG